MLLILPYALPTFMTVILVWQGMMDTDFGILNEIFNTNINWLGDPWWARFSVLLVNLVRIPYFFLVCTGALQSIPTDLREAAFVDSDRAEAFRRVTFPLLLIAVAPVLISSFAFQLQQLQRDRAAHGRRPAEARPDRRPDGHPPHRHDEGRVRPGR